MARRRTLTPVIPVTIVALVVAIAAVAFAARARSHAIATARLPPVPDLSGRPSAMVAHLRDADAAARASPRSPDAVGALGVAYHADLFYAPAAEAYALASELDPNDWRWRYNLALLHVERGEAAQAADSLKAVLSMNPQHRLAWLRLGDAEFKRARFREAEAAYQHAEEEAPALASPPPTVPPGRAESIPVAVYASMGLARMEMQNGDVDRARERLERVVASAPRLGAAYRLLADAHRASGRVAEADRLVKLAAPYIAPHDPVVDQLARESRNSVFLLKQVGAADPRRDAAWREWLARRATEVDPTNPDVIYEMGALLQQSGRSREALTFFSRHLDMVEPGGDAQQTLVQIGKCYSDLGELEQAESTLRRALALSDDAVGWYNLGYVMEQRGREPIAETYYRRALTVDPSLASAHNNLATLLARRGQFEDARVHLTDVVRLHPSRADGYNNLGALFLQQGKADAAQVYLLEALELDPTHADAHANMGAALARRGQFADALRHLDEALRFNPNHAAARANRDAVARSLR